MLPIRLGLEIIPELYPVELVRVISNKRTNPFLIKKCEIEFVVKYRKLALGERISLLKFASESLLYHFVEEKNEKILKAMISNPRCTENLIIRLINRREDRSKLYNILTVTNWLKQKNISLSVSYDKEAPIRAWEVIIPFLPLKRLKEILTENKVHENIQHMIRLRIKESNIK